MEKQSGAYNEFYLPGNNEVTRLVFVNFKKDTQYDTLSLINSYMRSSDIRKRMDEGNMIALYSGHKQLYNSIDKATCLKDALKNQFYNADILRWMGTVYSTLQWQTCLYSRDISTEIPADALYGMYERYKDESVGEVCNKLYELFLADKEFPLT